MSRRTNKIKFFRIVLALLTLTALPALAFAQGPGDPVNDGCDPFDGCPVPLDSWVMFLTIVAVLYGAYHLHKKQKTASV